MENKQRNFLNINTIKELSLQLGLPADFLTKIAEDIDNHYSTFSTKDKKGQERKIYNPNLQLKLVHKKINNLLNKINFPNGVQGGIIKRSTFTNASLHTGKKQVANYDIKKFFPSIDFHVVYKAFINQKCCPEVARLLTRLTTVESVLPTGFGTSPKISGLVLLNIDYRLNKLLNPLGLTHSFWIDDLTISGNYPIKKLESLIDKIFRQEGFKLHEESEKRKISKKSERQICTGLVVNYQPNQLKSIRGKLKNELYLCKKYGVRNFLKNQNINIDAKTYLIKLGGRVSFLTSIAKNQIYKKLSEDIIKIEKN